MIKKLELSTPTSCINKAADDEPVFVLRAMDKAAPAAIAAWVGERLLYGMNKADDPKIVEATDIMKAMGEYRANKS